MIFKLDLAFDHLIDITIFSRKLVFNLLISHCRKALETIGHLTDSLDLSDYASRIIHPLVRTLDTCPPLHMTCMDTLCTLVGQLKHNFSIFIPMVTKVIERQKINHQRYHALSTRILKVCAFKISRNETFKFCITAMSPFIFNILYIQSIKIDIK